MTPMVVVLSDGSVQFSEATAHPALHMHTSEQPDSKESEEKK